MHYSIGDYIEDIVQNAIEAGSTHTTIEVREEQGHLAVWVKDTGKGMTKEEIAKALDPYGTDLSKHPGRRVGLGLPFLIQCIRTVEGDFDIQSEPGKGTTVYFRIPQNHIDSPPLGYLEETFHQCLCYPNTEELHIHRIHGDESYTLIRSELKEILGDLESVGSQALLKEYINSQETDLRKGEKYGKNDFRGS